MKSSLVNLKAIFRALAISSALFIAPLVSAEEYNYHIGDFDTLVTDQNSPMYGMRKWCNNMMVSSSPANEHQLYTKYLDLRYNTTTKTLTIETEFDDRNGKLPTGFHFSLSDGPMPQGAGHLAKIYFDATNTSDVKVTSYTYNTVANHCGNYTAPTINGTTYKYNMGSWLVYSPTPYTNPQGNPNTWVPLYTIEPENWKSESILSSAGINSGDVLEKSSSTSVCGANNCRQFRLVLDTTRLNAFVPKFPKQNDPQNPAPYTFQGAQFASNLGLWFYAVNTNSIAYNNSGLLSGYEVSSCYVCDFGDAVTNQTPTCDSVVPSSTKIRPGDKITAKITGTDPEKDSLLFTYSGNPTGSNFDQANNSILVPDSNKKVEVNFDWIPGLKTEGSYTVNVTLTQQYGSDQASVSCPFSFDVEGCQEIDWKETINAIDDTVNFNLGIKHAVTVLRRIGKIRGKKTVTEISDTERSKDLSLESWTILTSLQRNNVIRQNCGSNVTGCESVDTTKTLNRVNQITAELYTIVEKYIPVYKKVMKRSGLSASIANKRSRSLLNSATTLKDSASVSISSLPGVVYSCEPIGSK